MNEYSRVGASAVVFAYHDVGVQCLEALLESGVRISLLVTHQDNPSENIWFESVAETAARNDIPVVKPADPNTRDMLERIRQIAPDFIFSFYYRQMLGEALLALPTRGAFNVHGSLLPDYRGRVPLNWAIIHGEHTCGVSLHRMEIKPDAGPLLAQRAVRILRNDTALLVFQKLKYAAEAVVLETLPELLAGTALETPMDLASGSYFPGRKPADGRIDWQHSAWDIHNLIRAVAPPYPGAFFDAGQHRLDVLGSYYREEKAYFDRPCLYYAKGDFWADCTDGQRFMITDLLIDGENADSSLFEQIFGKRLYLSETPKTVVKG